MELLVASILGELASRSINFIINKCSKPPALEMEDSLQRALLRAQVIVDEAMGQHIANQAMLHQLNMLRNAMHKGHYMLDTFRYQPHDEEDAKDQPVSHSSSLSKVNSRKGFCFSGRGAQILEGMRVALDNLRSVILDANELALFLTSYPRQYRQPYSMHLLLGNGMFARQMEAELVINFLLHTQPHGAEELEVLPTVGPGPSCRVGKSTLVGHVCKDERVRDHFSGIVFLSDHDLTDDELAAFREGCAMKQQNRISDSSKDGLGRLLLVVEVVRDLNEDSWNRVYSASKRWMPRGSKIIITSWSDKVTKLGTTRALTLKHLSHEAYWYFFKTLTFGSTDPTVHPRLANLAMEIARMLNGTLIGANITAHMLRDNFDIHFWLKVVAFMRGHIQKHVSKFGEHPYDFLNQNRPHILGECYQCSSQEKVPKITLHDMMYGNAKLPRRFEALAWKSRIPPYYNYIYACEIKELKATATKRKRPVKNRSTIS
ncbi:hypothetical protein SETIT_2G009800v2 [Setaria italica]|uniref:NB-ARC domain-containing protein n=1 Tax=Setaria italica TaxID=4555 RepID=K3ZZS4_SETIT|nr:hypothetical protein SETIT_2G009800v2 [Setaria italica]